MMYRSKVAAFLAAMGVAVAGSAHAAGFAISDKSVSGLGAAFAGAAAVAEDASTVYANPAGMMQLSGDHTSVGVYHLVSNVTFNDDGSTTPGAGGNTTGVNTVLPNVYYATELSPALRAGFGVYSPFGLGLDYDQDWTGRYHTISTKLRTINITPAIAYQANPRLALGMSLDAQYADAIMKQAVDFGTLCVAQYADSLGMSGAVAACDAAGLQPQQHDGLLDLEGKSWSYGISLGATYQASAATRVGAAYHGPVRHDFKGTANFDNVPAAFATTFTDGDGSLRLNLPEIVSLSVAHAASERLTLLADYSWTGWGRHKELRVQFDNGLPDSVREEAWNDASRYALGAHYRMNHEWLLRAGFAYDQTPVPDAEHRSPRVPDTDRRWYTLGASWMASADLSVDFAFAYLSAKAIPIDNTDAFGHRLTGSFDASGGFTSMQANWKF